MGSRALFHAFCALLAAIGVAASAVAQEAAPTPVVAPDALVEDAPVADAQLTRARATIQLAKGLFAAAAYDAALAEFTRAYESLSGHPKQYIALHNIAVCHERMQRYDLALEFYERYLAQAPATESDRAEVEAVTRVLRSLLARLELESNVRAEVWIDGRKFGWAPGTLIVPAGRHSIELRATSYEGQRRELQVAAGEARRMRFSLTKLARARGAHPAYFWTSLGASGASLVAGAVLGGLALSASDEGERKALLHLDARRDSERARNLSTAADGCFASAVVFGVASTVLYFVTDWPEAGAAKTGALAGGARF